MCRYNNYVCPSILAAIGGIPKVSPYAASKHALHGKMRGGHGGMAWDDR